MYWIHPCSWNGKSAPFVQRICDWLTAVGKGLRDIGVEKGDRVAIIIDNSVEWAALSYGANALGAYTAMYTHQHGKDWAYIIADATLR